MGNRCADPEGKQLQVLREALQNLLSGRVRVQSDIIHLAVFHEIQQLSPREVSQLAKGYIWFDWFSIPQITVRRVGDNPDMRSDVKRAVDSIPAYVEAADLFIVACPSWPHADTGETCTQQSWASRGWCRVELAAAALSLAGGRVRRLLVVRSPTNLFLMSPTNFLFAMPGHGDFEVEADREMLLPVMQQIVDRHLVSLQLEGKGQLVRERLLTAMRSSFLAGLGAGGQQGFATVAHDSLEQFQKRFHFRSLCYDSAGLGPVLCAAVAGNVGVLRHLASLKASMDETVGRKAQRQDLLLVAGDTALMAACLFNSDPAVIEVLLELRANLHAKSRSGYTAVNHAAISGHTRCLEYLLEQRADPDNRTLEGGRPLIAAAIAGQVKSVETLLNRGVSVSTLWVTGIAPLSVATLSGSLDCCRLLLTHRANVNAVACPPNALGAALNMTLSCIRPLLPTSGPLHVVAMADQSTTLHLAAMEGHVEIVRLLIEAAADSTLCNRAGLTALDLAKRSGHNLVTELLEGGWFCEV